jgi:hypothetical protein
MSSRSSTLANYKAPNVASTAYLFYGPSSLEASIFFKSSKYFAYASRSPAAGGLRAAITAVAAALSSAEI